MVRIAVLALSFLLVALPLLRADTVYLKTGGLIKDCRMLKEEAGTVFLRTPGGQMGVPREDILRIEKEESVFDSFDKQRVKLRKDDANGHFELARWCRQESGLRQEANELLKKVIARRDRIDRAFRRIIREGVDAGLFARRDPKLTSFVIFGAINWIPRWYDPAGLATSHEIAQVFADYLVAGLQKTNRLALAVGARKRHVLVRRSLA